MRFETWLRRQIERDDPIGDLAKDYARALKHLQRPPFSNNFKEFSSFDIHNTMSHFDISFGAQEALEEAIEEFKSERE